MNDKYIIDKRKWYRVKWVDNPLTSWMLQESLPEDMVIKFHCEKTHSGKKRKAKKKKN